MTTRTAREVTVDTTDTASVRKQLEQGLRERRILLDELEPRALPTIDPVAYQTAAAHRVRINEISAALERLERGVYGRCARCGGNISPARLKVVPHATACIDCQNRAEAA